MATTETVLAARLVDLGVVAVEGAEYVILPDEKGPPERARQIGEPIRK